MRLTDYWYTYTHDVVTEHGGITSVSRPMMRKHLVELRQQYSVDDIRTGFHRFAEMIRQGKVDVRRKPAWLVFYGQRQRFIRPVMDRGVSISDARPPTVDWSKVPQPRSPFKQG